MKLRLKEDPREWTKFAAVISVAAGLLCGLLWWRGIVPAWTFQSALGAGAATTAAALARPSAFRGFYRSGMTVSHAVGQFMGGVLLSIVFLALLTPMGWALRLFGKDLLGVRPRPNADTYWVASKKPRGFDRLY